MASREAPKHIYLQYYGEDDDEFDPNNEEVTWCQDRIYDSDVMYVHADALTAAEEERDRLRSAFAPELIAESTRLHVENDQLAADRRELVEALENISSEGRHARSGGTAYRMAVIARAEIERMEAEHGE